MSAGNWLQMQHFAANNKITPECLDGRWRIADGRCMQKRRTFLSSAAATGVAAAADNDKLDSEKFRIAALQGDLAGVERYLDADPALLYARDAHGNSVFTLACLAGQTKVADLFVKKGLVMDIFEASARGDVPRATELDRQIPRVAHARSVDGRTPLHFAAAAGQVAMAGFLNAKGADLSAGPESPLLAAAGLADVNAGAEVGQVLLANGSDPNARRQDGMSALQLAAARGNKELIRRLIHRGAATNDAGSVDIVYFGGRYAEDKNGAPVTREDNYGLPQQFIEEFVTVAHFDFDKVKRMLKTCPTLLMTRAPWDELAVEAAAHMGMVDEAEYLVDLGSPVSTCTAAILGLAPSVKRMLASDPARLRERGAHDLPLLAFTAFGKERVEVAELILQAGGDVDIRGFGQTTLQIAAAKGHINLAKLLLERGAAVNASSKGGTATAIAAKRKQTQMVEFLTQHGGLH
jgi:ankyrin repeat protein